MEIKPTYITFEQAKLLKEKGFDVECIYHYGKTNDYISIGSDIPATNWNKLIDDHMDEVELYSRPEQWQVVEWLRINHGIWVEVRYYESYKVFIYEIVGLNNSKGMTSKGVTHLNSPQEATSAAFDYILKELI